MGSTRYADGVWQRGFILDGCLLLCDSVILYWMDCFFLRAHSPMLNDFSNRAQAQVAPMQNAQRFTHREH